MTLGIDIGGTSVKAAILRDGVVVTGRSAEFAFPSLETLRRAVRQAIPDGENTCDSVGLCVPGLLDERGERVLYSANIPALQGVLLADLLEVGWSESERPKVFADVHAAAYDFWWNNRESGRLLAISMGTGVGASVLDNGVLLRSTGAGSGHFGQIDVSLDERAPVGPGGVRGSLEAYCGTPALRRALGDRFIERLGTLDPRSEQLRALARAIRIGHAIYRPQTIALLGYVGMSLSVCKDAIMELSSRELTPVARPDWRLMFASSPFHAAIGAARLALIEPDAGV